MAADHAAPRIHLAVAHGGRTVPFHLAPTSSLAHLITKLADSFNLAPASLKLVVKGKKLALGDLADAAAGKDVGAAFEDLLGHDAVAAATGASEGTGEDAADSKLKPVKALLVGTPSSTLDTLHATEDLRAKKHAAFVHHASRASLARPTPASRIRTLDDAASAASRHTFHALEPFPASVPELARRRAMLERLAADPAVRDVMRRHEFAVGILTELHPVLQPTLLGLNTNFGQKVSLRLLTDRLDGTRAYNEVRKVLLHELAHNVHGNHDTGFKELNSQLNKEVAAFESSPSFEPWDPSPSSSSTTSSSGGAEEAHRLNEAEAERVWDSFAFGREDEVELRRDRVGRAAEERARRARAGKEERGR
ncbi:hypothetical protein JCM9279_003564 [Rhodotorula babjevae]